jgi:hypothetical protein
MCRRNYCSTRIREGLIPINYRFGKDKGTAMTKLVDSILRSELIAMVHKLVIGSFCYHGLLIASLLTVSSVSAPFFGCGQNEFPLYSIRPPNPQDLKP